MAVHLVGAADVCDTLSRFINGHGVGRMFTTISR
jgi:hypothetical protein